jgi:magnesium transporter
LGDRSCASGAARRTNRYTALVRFPDLLGTAYGSPMPYCGMGERLRGGAKARLRTLDRDVASLGEYDAQLSAEISFLLDATFGLIGLEQNNIIKVFSIAAVLFLPPTLVGTVYGMNFEHMPELHWTIGYPFALGLMVLSALAPYYWFKYRGWL